MKTIDQIGNEIHVYEAPKRIVSLVPSQTELLHYLGLEQEVVGITKFCIHPENWFRKKVRVGGTKQVDFKKIELLNPDLIIANKEENTESDIRSLQKNYNVWVSDIITIEDSFSMIESIGSITSKIEKANKLIEGIKLNFNSVALKKNKPRVVYLIWQEPFIAVGKATFINSMLEKCGFENCIVDSRYPEISTNELNILKPDFIFLSSEPFPFSEKHINLYKNNFPFSKLTLVDGEMFSWYGNRLLKFPSYFEKLKVELSIS